MMNSAKRAELVALLNQLGKALLREGSPSLQSLAAMTDEELRQCVEDAIATLEETIAKLEWCIDDEIARPRRRDLNGRLADSG